MLGTAPPINGGASGPATATGGTTNAGNSAVIQTGGGNRNGAGVPVWVWVAAAIAAAGVGFVALRKKK